MTAWMMELDGYDRRALLALVRRQRAALRRVFGAITHLGDTAVVIGLVATLTVGAAPGMQEVGIGAACALILSQAFVQILKRTISRPRPRLPEGMRSLVRAPDRFSFPSGHSAAALCVALPIALALPLPLGIAVVTLGLLVGVSRCYLGVHYPGDVIAGWILAAASALLAPRILGVLR